VIRLLTMVKMLALLSVAACSSAEPSRFDGPNEAAATVRFVVPTAECQNVMPLMARCALPDGNKMLCEVRPGVDPMFRCVPLGTSTPQAQTPQVTPTPQASAPTEAPDSRRVPNALRYQTIGPNGKLKGETRPATSAH
jgi:hypothetical protein